MLQLEFPATLRYSRIWPELSKDCFGTISGGPGGIVKRLSKDCFWDPREDPGKIVKRYPQEGSNRPKDCQTQFLDNLLTIFEGQKGAAAEGRRPFLVAAGGRALNNCQKIV